MLVVQLYIGGSPHVCVHTQTPLCMCVCVWGKKVNRVAAHLVK